MEENTVKGKMNGVRGREACARAHTHTDCQVLIPLVHQITTGGPTATSPPLPLSLPPPWLLPEDGALEVAPLHRNRVCHENQSFLIWSIKMPPPGPTALEGNDSLLVH